MMSSFRDIGIAELKLLLIRRFSLGQRVRDRFCVYLEQALGKPFKPDLPRYLEVNAMIIDWISGLAASRMKLDQCSSQLVSRDDLKQIIPLLVSKFEEGQEGLLSAKERERIEGCVADIIKNVWDFACSVTSPGVNTYDEYWHWVEVVTELATQRSVKPLEFLFMEDAGDVLSRKMFTRAEFVVSSRRLLGKFLDVEILRVIFVQPLIEMFKEGLSEIEQEELEQAVETEFMPKIAEELEKIRVVAEAWILQEAERVYGEQ